ETSRLVAGQLRGMAQDRESYASTLPELNRTLRSTLWTIRARDAPVGPRARAASRPGPRRTAPGIRRVRRSRGIQGSLATRDFAATLGFPVILAFLATLGSLVTPRSGAPVRCPSGRPGPARLVLGRSGSWRPAAAPIRS